jgi:hypothetical protein
MKYILLLLMVITLLYFYISLNPIIDTFNAKKDIYRIKTSGIYHSQRRIIAIGDLHGDYHALQMALQKGKVINKLGNWIGGNTHVVQLGDILDRRSRLDSNNMQKKCCDEAKIMDTLYSLQKESRKFGGGVHCILGNHELMNVMGDFRYTTPGTNKCFGGILQRKKLFQPGGILAKKIAKHSHAIIKIGDWVFVHGGLLPHHLQKYTISEINRLLKNILLGKVSLSKLNTRQKEIVLDENGIFWTRLLSGEYPHCKLVTQTLKLLGIGKYGGIVVGHTPQEEGINSCCHGNVWKVDSGMSLAFGKHNAKRIQVLEILGNGKTVRVLR